MKPLNTDALRDKVVVITGGARGIGFETATQLVAAKARVILGDVDGEAVGKAAADLGVEGLELDVTSTESIEAFLDEAERIVGPVDVWVNNAGIMPVGPFLNYDAALIRRTIDIDLMGVIWGTQAAARRMVARGHGHIVNVASVARRPGRTSYVLSSIVSVRPATPPGRDTSSFALSPGHGRHSGSVAVGSLCTTGMPPKKYPTSTNRLTHDTPPMTLNSVNFAKG